MIYIAGPYWDPNPDVIEQRMKVVYAVIADLCEGGHHPITPMLMHAVVKEHNLPNDFEFWGALSLKLLGKCSSMYVLELPGWKNSKGLTAEIKFCKEHDIPVVHLKVDGYLSNVTGDCVASDVWNCKYCRCVSQCTLHSEKKMSGEDHKKYLDHLLSGATLGYNDTRKVFEQYILGDKGTEVLAVAFLTVYAMRSPTPTEMTAVRDAIREKSVNIDLVKDLQKRVPLKFNILIDALGSIACTK